MDGFIRNHAGNMDLELESIAYSHLVNRQIKEAYLVLKSMESIDNRASSLFNMALCTYIAESYEEALAFIDKAYIKFKELSLKESFETSQRTDVYKFLAHQQARDGIYRFPLNREYIERFPKSARENIIMLSIDICLKLKLIDRAERLISSLNGEFSDLWEMS